MHRFDFVVIGSGPAGQRGAIQAAKLEKRVAVVERRQVVGGVSLHTGTIPSKTLREAVLYLAGGRESSFYGRSQRPRQASIEDLMHRLEITLAHEIEVMRHQLARNGVTVVYGTASFLDPQHIQVVNALGDVSVLEAEKVLIATGTHPRRPPDIHFDDTIIDSDGVPRMKRLPRTLTVVGAGVIGVEYASLFSALDVEVTLIDERTALLDFLDREVVDELLHYMRDRGVVVRLGEQATKLEKGENGHILVYLASGKRLYPNWCWSPPDGRALRTAYAWRTSGLRWTSGIGSRWTRTTARRCPTFMLRAM